VRVLLVTAEVECSKCREAKAVLAKMSERFADLEIVAMKVNDPEAAAYGIVMSPTVIVGDTVVASGRAPNEARLATFLEGQTG
jgi:hypothetical protein